MGMGIKGIVGMMALAVLSGCSTTQQMTVAGSENEMSVQQEVDVVEVVAMSEGDKSTGGAIQEEVDLRTAKEIYDETKVLPSLYTHYAPYFSIGVAIEAMDLESAQKRERIIGQFNSLTCENVMKPDAVLNRTASIEKGDEMAAAINMSRADTLLQFAMEQNMGMRGHTLIWHSQTPRWFFTEGYNNAEDAPFVTREVMIARMENYIKDQMTYVNTHYPGVVYAWDVVNEAIDPGHGHEALLRTADSYWYQVIGEDYIALAFTFARAYQDPEQKLFYNDYNTYEKDKLTGIYNMVAQLKEKGLIDGIGMQSHLKLEYPTMSDYEYAIKKYAELDLEIQITELDIDVPSNDVEAQEKLAKRYKRLMLTLQTLKKNDLANITNVTLWGLTDNRSWLNYMDNTPSWPLLFDSLLRPKDAYFGMLQDDSIKLY